jgi:hypothetical protein
MALFNAVQEIRFLAIQIAKKGEQPLVTPQIHYQLTINIPSLPGPVGSDS